MSGRHEGPSEAKKARDSEKAKQSGSLQDRYCEPKGATNGDAERISGAECAARRYRFFYGRVLTLRASARKTERIPKMSSHIGVDEDAR